MSGEEQKNGIRSTLGATADSVRPSVIRRYRRIGLVVLAIAVACLLAYFIAPTEDRDKMTRSVIEGLMIGGVYSILALAVVVVYKASKAFNLTFGGAAVVLVYIIWWLAVRREMPAWAVIAIVLAAGVVLGLAVNRFVMRPMVGKGGMGSFVATMTIGAMVLPGLVVLLFGGDAQAMPKILPQGGFSILGLHFSYIYLYAFAISLVLFASFAAFFRFTKIGLAMRAVSEDTAVSQSLGISVKMIFAATWAVAGAAAAVAALLTGSMFGVSTSLGGFILAASFPVIILGGLESIPGALLAALALGMIESLTGTYVDPHLPGFREVLPSVFMLLILLLRPHGLFGQPEIRRI